MNEKLDLTKILKDCPRGKKLYSPIFGEVTFEGIEDYRHYSIIVKNDSGDENTFTKYGVYYEHKDAECMLFPSNNNRDWSTFKTKQQRIKPSNNGRNLLPFQKVLARDNVFEPWRAQFFSHYCETLEYPYICMGTAFKDCIPYEGNENLLNTTYEPKTLLSIKLKRSEP